MHVDECGAPERIAGAKLYTVATEHGKLTPDDLGRWEARRGDDHHAQQRVVSITQSSELGTVYTLAETRAIADAHPRARTCSSTSTAPASPTPPPSLGASLKELTTDCGVDVVSFGATKNGLAFGDSVVFLRPELADGFEFVRKQLGQLASKMRFLSAQFEALLARRPLARERDATRTRWPPASPAPSRDLPGLEIVHPVEAERRLRAAPARGDRPAPLRAPRRAPVPHLGRGRERRALDVRVGHDRGGRRRVRGRRRRGGRGHRVQKSDAMLSPTGLPCIDSSGFTFA